MEEGRTARAQRALGRSVLTSLEGRHCKHQALSFLRPTYHSLELHRVLERVLSKRDVRRQLERRSLKGPVWATNKALQQVEADHLGLGRHEKSSSHEVGHSHSTQSLFKWPAFFLHSEAIQFGKGVGFRPWMQQWVADQGKGALLLSNFHWRVAQKTQYLTDAT